MLRDRVASMIRRLERGDVNMHGFLLSVGGRLKAGAYYRPFREGQPHRMYSVSKTMTGLAVGILADEGKLDLDRPVAEYFPDLLPENPDGRVLRQTIRPPATARPPTGNGRIRTGPGPSSAGSRPTSPARFSTTTPGRPRCWRRSAAGRAARK